MGSENWLAVFMIALAIVTIVGIVTNPGNKPKP